ncbi:aminotransferase [Aureobasidium pullulans]|nr:aminotransferase [Aureobasidium pullulans]
MAGTTTIDLLSGWPAQSLFPTNELSSAAVAVLKIPETYKAGLNYGDDEGYLPLRQNLSKYLANFYTPERKASVDRVCITGGASQNLACILQVFTDPLVTRTVWIIEPSYYLAFRIFEDAGFHGDKLRGVPPDEGGVDLGFLETAMKQVESTPAETTQQPIKPCQPHRKIYRHIIYCVPTFSNPTGLIMPLSKRQELLQLARKHDALLICDDVYDFLRWPSRPGVEVKQATATLPRIVDLDILDDEQDATSFGNCVSNGSFSKILGPGCRVGWAESTPRFIHGLTQAGSTRSGGAPSQMMSTIINELFKENFLKAHIEKTLIPEYARRYALFLAAIKHDLYPLGFRLDESVINRETVGGFFMWLQLPDGIDCYQLAARAAKHGVSFSIGPTTAVTRPLEVDLPFKNFIRLCFTFEEDHRLVEGVRRIALAAS